MGGSVFAQEQCEQTPEGIALRDERTAFTWVQLASIVRRGANKLLSMGAGRPMRVGVYAHNSAETAIAYLIALRAGMCSVPVNFHLTAEETAYILRDAGVSTLFVGPENAERGVVAARSAGASAVVGWRGAPGTTPFEAWLEGATDAEPPSDMPALPHLHYTSGTTGRPKGVETPPTMFPQGATVAEAFSAFRMDVRRAGFSGPALAVAPLYHTSPLRAVRALAGGSALVSTDRFDAEGMLRLVEEHRIGSINLTPTHFVRLLGLPEDVRKKYDLSSLKIVRHTGAPCPVHVKRAIIDWLGPIVVEVYGATESGPTTSINSEEWLAHPGSVGRCIPPFTVEVRSESGEPMPAGEVGVLYFRDRTRRGIIYANDPEKTAQAHVEPGVFTLGEMGYVDEEGFVYLTDRISDMIVSGGVNIYPAEIENVLLEHPAVHDVAVIGVPNDEMGEEVWAILVLEKGATSPAESELEALCRGRLAGYKRPRQYRFVEDIGRNALGKVNKRDLRKRFAGADIAGPRQLAPRAGGG